MRSPWVVAATAVCIGCFDGAGHVRDGGSEAGVDGDAASDLPVERAADAGVGFDSARDERDAAGASDIPARDDMGAGVDATTDRPDGAADARIATDAMVAQPDGGSGGGADRPPVPMCGAAGTMRLRGIHQWYADFFGDVDGDGFLDRVLAGEWPNPRAFSVRRGDGTGLFLPATQRDPDASVAIFPLAVVDFDGDRRADAVARWTDARQISHLMVLRGGSGGSLTSVDAAGVTRDIPAPFNRAMVADFTGDHKPDAAFLFQTTAGPLTISVYAGDALTVLSTTPRVTTTTLNASVIKQSVMTGDVDQDGKVDLMLMYTAGVSESGVLLFRGRGDGTFEAGQQITGVHLISGAVLHDVDGDGPPDLLLAPTSELYRNQGNGTFAQVAWPFSMSGSFDGQAFGDFDDDGHEDVALLMYRSGSHVLVEHGDGRGTFSRPEVLAGDNMYLSLVAGNFDGEGGADLVTGGRVFLGANSRAPCAAVRDCTPGIGVGDTCQRLPGPALGGAHSCINSAVACVGAGSAGQLGNGAATASRQMVSVVQPAVPMLQVYAGKDFSCGIPNFQSDDAVYCWGRNDHGQLGDGTTIDRASPVRVLLGATPGAIKSLALGESHACAITVTDVRCWGRNNEGQLGDGTTVDRSTAVVVPGTAVATAQEVGAGRAHTCARLRDGQVMCWGRNVDGELGDGSAALRQTTPVYVSAAVQVTRVAVGGSHNCVLSGGGNTYCWGSNARGQLGADLSVASSRVPRLVTAFPVAKVLAQTLATGADHTCIASTGATRYNDHAPAVLCWGANNAGQLGDGTRVDRSAPVAVKLNPFVVVDSVIAGGDHTCGWLVDDAANEATKMAEVCWGRNTDGELTGAGGAADNLVPTLYTLP